LFDSPVALTSCKEILRHAASELQPFAKTLPPQPGPVLERYVQKDANKALRAEIERNEVFYPQAQAMSVIQMELMRKVETLIERLRPVALQEPDGVLLGELQSLFRSAIKGRSLATIRGARSALTLVFPDVDGTSLTDSIYLTRFISAMKHRLPANVRYGEHEVFDVSLFFDFFRAALANADLTHRALRAKTIVLLRLFLRVRSSCLTHIRAGSIRNEEDAIRLTVDKSKSRPQPQDFWLARLPDDPAICPASAVRCRKVGPGLGFAPREIREAGERRRV
jgi:hypothetical protein